MANYNHERGKAIFLKKTAEAKESLSDQAKERLSWLEAAFSDAVSVMAEPGTKAAARCASACVSAAADASISDDDLIGRVSIIYETLPATHSSVYETKESRAATKSIEAEIMAQQPKIVSARVEIYDSESETTSSASVDVEFADLVHDTNGEDLSIEGKRSRRMLSASHDTLSGEIAEEISGSEGEWAVIRDLGGELTIHCPNCEGAAVFPLGDGGFGCFDCDATFKSPLSIGDLLMEKDESRIESDFSIDESVGGRIVRIEGKIRSRGTRIVRDEE